MRALRAAVSVRVRGAVPSCPCAAHAGLGPFPAFLGEPWLPVGVAGLPVRAPRTLWCWGLSRVLLDSRSPGAAVCATWPGQLVRAGLGFMQVPGLLLVLGPAASVPSPWSASMESVWKQHSK